MTITYYTFVVLSLFRLISNPSNDTEVTIFLPFIDEETETQKS